MDIDSVIQLVCMFGSKMIEQKLTEYEMLMYEQACRFLERYFKGELIGSVAEDP